MFNLDYIVVPALWDAKWKETRKKNPMHIKERPACWVTRNMNYTSSRMQGEDVKGGSTPTVHEMFNQIQGIVQLGHPHCLCPWFHHAWYALL